MTLISLFVGICIILFALWLVKTYMPAPWQVPALVIIVILALAWLAFTFFPHVASVRVGTS